MFPQGERYIQKSRGRGGPRRARAHGFKLRAASGPGPGEQIAVSCMLGCCEGFGGQLAFQPQVDPERAVPGGGCFS